jgi:peptidoglycan-N-acetylglucosamine deacetylase
MSSNQYPGNSPSSTRQIAKLLLSAALPRPMFITHGRSSLRSVCLTFDDGPHPEVTPRLLDLLARENVAATFFVLGSLAVRYPDIIKRMESEGHTVGNHSYSHPDPATRSTLAMYREVRQSDQVLRGILRNPTRLYRPPCGKLRALDLLGLLFMRQTVVLWNVDPKDFAQPSSDRLSDWFKTKPLRGGDLVLLHDTESSTVSALPSIIADTRRAGLHFAGVKAWTRW